MSELDFSRLPNHDWILESVTDLGSLCGACQRCGTLIRYTHHCRHPIGISAIVGCICCGDITGNLPAAQQQEREVKNRSARLAKYLRSSRWYQTSTGNLTMTYHGNRITVFASGARYKAVAAGTFSKRSYPSIEAAKIAAFNFLASEIRTMPERI